MSVPSSPPTRRCSPEDFCSLQKNVQPTLLPKNIKELVRRVDRILLRRPLCPHAVDQLSLLHRNIEQIEREKLSIPQKYLLSLALIKKVQITIKSLLFPLSYLTSQRAINLYYLSRFSPAVPSGVSIVKPVLHKMREQMGKVTGMLIAQKLPCCLSREEFLRDLQLLTGLGQDSAVEIRQRRVKVLQLAECRERRLLALEQGGAAGYPPYLDQILHSGFTYLYNHLLDIAEHGEGDRCRQEIREFDASNFCRIVLDVRHAIVEHIERELPEDFRHATLSDIVFLIGNTGSGKSTAAALLRGEQLKREGDYYEVTGQSEIGHSLTASCTLLPNVHVNRRRVCVDFPGFNDTRGDLINLGIELAFKALVDCYHPKIVIVESIKALESSRGTHATDLGKKLRRMLGERAPCSVFLTHYLRLAEHMRLSAAIEKKKELEIQIKQLREALSQREKAIGDLEEKLLSTSGEGGRKIDKYKEKIQKLKQGIAELEEKKRRTSLTSFEKKALTSFTKKLPKHEIKLQELEQNRNSSPEQQSLEKQIHEKKEKREKKQREIDTKSGELELCKERVIQEQKSIEEKSCELLKLIGIGNKRSRVAELHDLEDPATLKSCEEVLGKAKPVENTRKKLSDSYQTQLLEILKAAFSGGRMPPPPPLQVDDLQRYILKTSLTAVLTAECFPEIRDFLHLPEMETECIRKLDLHIVDEFSDALVRLIVIGSLKEEPKEDIIKNFIEKQVTNLSEGQSEEATRLQKKWQRLKERVLANSTRVAVDWSGLEQHYQSLLAKALAEISKCRGREQNLKGWDQWTASAFGVEGIIKLPNPPSTDEAKRSANQRAISEIDNLIDGLDHSFDRVKELRRMIEYKREIETQRQRCANALKRSVSFLKETQEAINQTQEIYDRGAKPGETWKDGRKKINIELRAKLPDFYFALQKNSCLVELLRAELCTRADSNNYFFCRLFEKVLVGEKVTESFLRAIINEKIKFTVKNLELLVTIAEERLLSSSPLLLQIVRPAKPAELAKLAEIAERAVRAKIAELELAKRTELAEIAGLVKRAGQAGPAGRAELAEITGRAVRAVLAEVAEIARRAERINLAELAQQAMQLERAEQLKELSKIKEELEKLVSTESIEIITNAEQLLGLKNSFKEKNLLYRIRSINKELAERVGLNLDISLHRILLLDFLNRGLAKAGSDEAVPKEPQY